MKTRTWIVLADAASARLYEAAGPRGNWALVAELAKALEDGLLKEAYERLILVAPSAFLGLLQSELSDRVRGRIAALVDKDYLHLDQRQARERLEAQLHAT